MAKQLTPKQKWESYMKPYDIHWRNFNGMEAATVYGNHPSALAQRLHSEPDKRYENIRQNRKFSIGKPMLHKSWLCDSLDIQSGDQTAGYFMGNVGSVQYCVFIGSHHGGRVGGGNDLFIGRSAFLSGGAKFSSFKLTSWGKSKAEESETTRVQLFLCYMLGAMHIAPQSENFSAFERITNSMVEWSIVKPHPDEVESAIRITGEGIRVKNTIVDVRSSKKANPKILKAEDFGKAKCGRVVAENIVVLAKDGMKPELISGGSKEIDHKNLIVVRA